MSRWRTGGWLAGFAGLGLLASVPLAYELAMHEPDCQRTEQRILPRETSRAAALADAIVRRPDNADCELSRRGMSRADFLELMDDIAADRRLASDYASARRRR